MKASFTPGSAIDKVANILAFIPVIVWVLYPSFTQANTSLQKPGEQALVFEVKNLPVAKTENIANGFYSNALNNNSVRKEGDKILLTGTTGLELAEFLPINIEVNDFVLFKENAVPRIANGIENKVQR